MLQHCKYAAENVYHVCKGMTLNGLNLYIYIFFSVFKQVRFNIRYGQNNDIYITHQFKRFNANVRSEHPKVPKRIYLLYNFIVVHM
jgi:hypothetical protein